MMQEITIEKITDIVNTTLKRNDDLLTDNSDKIYSKSNNLSFGKIIDTNVIEQLDENLADFGVDSIVFIQIIVCLEEQFECEIPDEKLIFSEMNTINKIYMVLKDIKSNIE